VHLISGYLSRLTNPAQITVVTYRGIEIISVPMTT